MRFWTLRVAFLLALIMCAVTVTGCSSSDQTEGSRGRRTAEGMPDFSGIWQAQNTANWDLQAHAAKHGPVTALGAAFSVPAGLGVVEGDEIPYTAEALAKKQGER